MYTFSLESYLQELEVLVNIDSGLGATDGATEVALKLAKPLVEQGWILERHQISDECGECIVVKNREADHYDVMLVGHTDTVFEKGEVQKRPYYCDGKRAYGVGACDMKQGCLAISYVLRKLPAKVLEQLNIVIVFNPDEEIGSPYSKKLTDSFAKKTDYALVFEGASGKTTRVTQRKGLMRYHIEFIGKSGHAGYPFTNGSINAVNEMVYWISELNKLHSQETGTSINAGVVRGGQVVNVIPNYAELKLDIRYINTEEMLRVEELIDNLAEHAKTKGVVVRERGKSKTPPMELTPKARELCEVAKVVCDELGMTFETEQRGGLSDANHISACGCGTLDGMGPTGDGDHTENEYLEIDTIEPNLRFAYHLLCKLADVNMTNT